MARKKSKKSLWQSQKSTFTLESYIAVFSFKTARVGARSRDVSPDIHYSVRSDLHSPNLRTATRRRMCSRTPYMNENLSSSLRLYSTLKNSGKSSVVVWKNLLTGGPKDTQIYPRVSLSIQGTTTADFPLFIPQPRLKLTDFRITPAKSGFNAVRHHWSKTVICPVGNSGPHNLHYFNQKVWKQLKVFRVGSREVPWVIRLFFGAAPLRKV